MKAKEKYVPALRFHFLTKWFDFFLATTFPEKKIKQAIINQCGFGSTARSKVLDFGCGTLTLSIMAKEQYPNLEITGLDIDNSIIEIAKSKLDRKPFNIQLDKYDGGRLPYTDNEFNVVYSCLVFHHINDENKVSGFKEILRVMTPGGKLCLADFGKPRGFFRRVVFALFRRFDGEKNTRSNARGLLSQLIQDAGFVNIKEPMAVNTVFGTVVFIDAIKQVN